jgi:hypothetical protein
MGATEEVVAGEEVAVSGEVDVVVKRVVVSALGADDASVVKLEVERIADTDSADSVEMAEEVVYSSEASEEVDSVTEADRVTEDVGLLAWVDDDSVATVVTTELLGLQGLAMLPSPSDNKMRKRISLTMD